MANSTSINLFTLNCLFVVCLGMWGCAPPEMSESTTTPKNKPAKVEQKKKPETIDVNQEAAVGVGKKGHSYGGGPITEPASQYWRIKEKIAFTIQIPKAMQLFKASSITGKGPKSHEEFMEKIINVGAVELPELPDGLKYQYDVENESLMVVGQIQKKE